MDADGDDKDDSKRGAPRKDPRVLARESWAQFCIDEGGFASKYFGPRNAVTRRLLMRWAGVAAAKALNRLEERVKRR